MYYDVETISLVASQLKGVFYINDVVREVTFEVEKHKPSDTTRLKSYLCGLEPGKYKKKSIYESLGINSNNFSRLLNDEQIQELVLNERLIISHHAIEII